MNTENTVEVWATLHVAGHSPRNIISELPRHVAQRIGAKLVNNTLAPPAAA